MSYTRVWYLSRKQNKFFEMVTREHIWFRCSWQWSQLSSAEWRERGSGEEAKLEGRIEGSWQCSLRQGGCQAGSAAPLGGHWLLNGKGRELLVFTRSRAIHLLQGLMLVPQLESPTGEPLAAGCGWDCFALCLLFARRGSASARESGSVWEAETNSGAWTL